MNKKISNNTRAIDSDCESWDAWYPSVLRELDAFGNGEKQSAIWQEHLQRGKYCFYDCLIEDNHMLWIIVEYPDVYDGLAPFINDFIQLVAMIEIFNDFVISSLPLDSTQDYKDLKRHVLNHPQWHKIQKLARSLHSRLQEANKARK